MKSKNHVFFICLLYSQAVEYSNAMVKNRTHIRKYAPARRMLAVTVLSAVLIFLSSSDATLDGIVHRVRAGETLWGISRTYGVSVGKIREANKELKHTNLIRPGQRIFIPSADRIRAVEPMTRQMREILRQGRSARWEYIVIHHSATATGSAKTFDIHHRRRGFRTLGYHFIVANGTDNTRDGEIETGFRWERQWDGAHTKGNANRVGIGICLVGNFENSTPGRKQMDALIQLTTHLAYKYDIPLANIKGHKDFVSNTTKCPGRNFPWAEFRKALRERGIR